MDDYGTILQGWDIIFLSHLANIAQNMALLRAIPNAYLAATYLSHAS